MDNKTAWQLFRTGKIISKSNSRVLPKCEKCNEVATRGFFQVRRRFFCEKHFANAVHSSYNTYKIGYSFELEDKIRKGLILVNGN